MIDLLSKIKTDPKLLQRMQLSVLPQGFARPLLTPIESAATTTSKLGGTRIPMEKVGDLPPVKNRELVTIHRDGSVRYFALDVLYDAQKEDDVVALVYNDVNGPTLPEVLVSDQFKFDSTFQKCIITLRNVMARYVKRSFYHVSIYRTTDAKVTALGIYKLSFAVILRLRAAL